MCSIDDAEYPDVISGGHRRARKLHTCGECRRSIEPGEIYHYSQGLTDGYWWSGKWCAHCEGAGQWLNRVCNGWLLDNLLDEMVDHFQEGYNSLEFGRLIVGMRRKWVNRAGELMPIPDHDAVRAVAVRDMQRMVA